MSHFCYFRVHTIHECTVKHSIIGLKLIIKMIDRLYTACREMSSLPYPHRKKCDVQALEWSCQCRMIFLSRRFRKRGSRFIFFWSTPNTKLLVCSPCWPKEWQHLLVQTVSITKWVCPYLWTYIISQKWVNLSYFCKYFVILTLSKWNFDTT